MGLWVIAEKEIKLNYTWVFKYLALKLQYHFTLKYKLLFIKQQVGVYHTAL